MKMAIIEAKKAEKKEEVPVGAVIVKNGTIISRAHNKRESSNDPTGHAELIAIKKASKKLGDWRLSGCIVYVTLEPCPMCAGAIFESRIDMVIYGTPDKRTGALGSAKNIIDFPGFNKKIKIRSGVMKAECSNLLIGFFKKRRASVKKTDS